MRVKGGFSSFYSFSSSSSLQRVDAPSWSCGAVRSWKSWGTRRLMKRTFVWSQTLTEVVLAVLFQAEEAKHGCVIGQMRKVKMAKIPEKL